MSEDIKGWIDSLDYDQTDAVDIYVELEHIYFTDEPYDDL